jgi:hypothetical protein
MVLTQVTSQLSSKFLIISIELCEEGVGGTYFMKNKKGRRIAIFKPQDEEPFHVNNPKGYRPRANSDAGI